MFLYERLINPWSAFEYFSARTHTKAVNIAHRNALAALK
jgi:hypothetical protein